MPGLNPPLEVRMVPVPVVSLWLPILVSAVIVFVASSIIHMVLPYHRGDLRQLPQEDQVMAALRPFGLTPGDYAVPGAASMADMSTPAFKEKMAKGPVAFVTVRPSGQYSMARNLAMWFGYSIVVGILAAYLTSRALVMQPGADYLEVFRFAGTTAFIGYSLALLQNTIWYGRNWRMTLTTMFDGLLYGLLTAGTFGWLWPR
jgi:hypothetical protein